MLAQQILVTLACLSIVGMGAYLVHWHRKRPKIETPSAKALKKVVAEMLSELPPAQQDAVNVLLIASRSDWRTALIQLQMNPTEFLFVSARLKEEVSPKSE